MEIPLFAMILMTGVGFLVGFLHQVKKKLDKDIEEMKTMPAPKPNLECADAYQWDHIRGIRVCKNPPPDTRTHKPL